MKKKDVMKIVDLAIRHMMETEQKLWKRCMLEGCVYGIKGVDKKPKNRCIYCGTRSQKYYKNFKIDSILPIKGIKKKEL